MRVISANDYLHLDRPELNWILPNFIPHPGMVMLIGAPKAGKSFLAWQVALSVAQGSSIFDCPIRAPRTTLYLQLDTSEHVWRERLFNLHDANSTLPPKLLMVHPDDMINPLNILTLEGASWLHNVVNTANPDFTIIDVIRETHNADENSSTEMKQLGDVLSRIFHSKSLLLIHHASKIPMDVVAPDPVVYGRGSTYLTGKMDAYWLLHRGRLRVDSRFTETTSYAANQNEIGLFEFPELTLRLAEVEQAIMLVQALPGQSLYQAAQVANQRWGWSQLKFLRLLRGQASSSRASV